MRQEAEGPGAPPAPAPAPPRTHGTGAPNGVVTTVGRRLRRGRSWLRTDGARTLLVAVSWQALLTLAGRLLEQQLPVFAGGTVVVGPTPLSHMLRWDSWYYFWIAQGMAYQHDPSTQAFYPLFPLLIWLVRGALLGSIGVLTAGLLVNTAATWAASWALLAIGRTLFGRPQAGWLLVAAFLTAPAAFFLHVLYSEAVLAALGFAAYAVALRRRWHAMGGLLVLITAARLPGLLFVGLCFLEFWRAQGWRLRRLLRPELLWFPLSAGGLLGFMLYLDVTTGHPRGMFEAYDYNWGYQVLDPNIAATLGREVRVAWTAVTGPGPLGHSTVVDHLLPLAGLAVLLAAVIYLLCVWRADAIPLAGFGLAAVVMYTLHSQLVSVHRYLLVILVPYVALAHLARRGRPGRGVVAGVLYVGAGLQWLLYAWFVTGNWAAG